MSLAGGWGGIEGALRRFELAWIEPMQFAMRKHRRLAQFNIAGLDELAAGKVDWQPTTVGCVSSCGDFVAAERRYFAKYLIGDGPVLASRAALLRGVPCVLDLARYHDFEHYLRHLRRHSKGGILRQIRKARAQGFFCRRIFRDFYLRQRYEIDTSKWFRSGLVLATLFRPPPASEFGSSISPAQIAAVLGRPVEEISPGIVLPEPPPPACACHWGIDWGVFATEGAGRERLVGYLFLKRTGNLVRTVGLMAHGAYFAHNVMKLLFHDVIGWLLAREDPCVQGLRFLHYGAVEHGSEGLLAWKRSFEFTPMRYRCS